MANDMSPGGSSSIFDVTAFFLGETRGIGLFKDRFGRVRREFQLTLVGRWQGKVFVLEEYFDYGDGTRETREWHITKHLGRTFSATSDDCVGGARGETFSRSSRMRYRFRLQLGRRAMVVSFDDRMHLVDAGVVINCATVRKWGIRLGEAVIVFHKGVRPPHLAADTLGARARGFGR